MRRKRKNPIPILLLWSKTEQKRFIDAVERFVCAANDLQLVAGELRAEHDRHRRPRPRPNQSAAVDAQTAGPV
jgi:hypothetical protein